MREGGRFQCRFTGEETRKFCCNFMHVIDAIASPEISGAGKILICMPLLILA